MENKEREKLCKLFPSNLATLVHQMSYEVKRLTL